MWYQIILVDVDVTDDLPDSAAVHHHVARRRSLRPCQAARPARGSPPAAWLVRARPPPGQRMHRVDETNESTTVNGIRLYERRESSDDTSCTCQCHLANVYPTEAFNQGNKAFLMC